MSQESTDEKYMARCLQLAANGRQNAKPNPMVGAVIVCGGRIIGGRRAALFVINIPDRVLVPFHDGAPFQQKSVRRSA